MKKRLFLITLITALVFTMCGLTALADEETLAVSAFYATEDCIELETNLAVTSTPTAEITDRSSNEVKTANVAVESSKLYDNATLLTDSDNKRIKITLADGKYDLSKSYSVKVSVGGSVIFEKILSFNVLFQDDFEGYADTNAMLAKWDMFRKFQGTWDDMAATEEYIALNAEENGNNRLVFKKHRDNSVLTNKDVTDNTSQYDSYVLSFDVENARKGKLYTFVNCTVPWNGLYAGSTEWGTWQWGNTAGVCLGNAKQYWANTELNNLNNEKKTVTQITERTVGENDILRYYYDGIFQWEVPAEYDGTKFKYYGETAGSIQHTGYFGFMGSVNDNTSEDNYLYLDNIKAYKPIFRDIADILAISDEFATEACVELEMSSAVTTAPAVEIKNNVTGEMVSAAVALENSGKRIKITPANGKFDLESSYTINVSNITDGFDTLEFNKALYFNVLFQDDFEGYADTTAMLKKWDMFRKCQWFQWYDMAATEEYIALNTEANGNNRLVFKKRYNGSVLTNKDVTVDTKQYDSYVLSYDVENARNGQLGMYVNCSVPWDYYTGYSEWSTGNVTRVSYGEGDNYWANDELKALNDTKTTVTQITERTAAASDVQRYYYNGVFQWQVPSAYNNKNFKYIGDTGYFGFMGSTENNASEDNYLYLDNIKAYKAVWAEPVVKTVEVSDSMLSAKFIEIEYSSEITAVSAQKNITLTANGSDVPMSVSVKADGKTALITPEEPLKTGKLYILKADGVSDIYGNASGTFTKKFVVEDLFYDDFSTYASTADLDAKYTMVPQQNNDKKPTKKPSDSDSGVSLKNGALNITSAMGDYTVTPLIRYPQRKKWDANYIFEADIERVSEKDSLQIYDYAIYGVNFEEGGVMAGRYLNIYYWQVNAGLAMNCFVNNLTWNVRGADAPNPQGLDTADRNLMFRIDNRVLSVYNNKSLCFKDEANPIDVSDADFAIRASKTAGEPSYDTEYNIKSLRAYKIHEISEDKVTLRPLNSSKKDNAVNGEFMIVNNTNANIENATLYVAVLDKYVQNKVIGIQTISIPVLEAGKAEAYNCTINVTSGEANMVMGYLWDGEMHPLADLNGDFI